MQEEVGKMEWIARYSCNFSPQTFFSTAGSFSTFARFLPIDKQPDFVVFCIDFLASDYAMYECTAFHPKMYKTWLQIAETSRTK